MTIQCCKCKMYKVGNTWHQLAAVPDGSISHGFCPACMNEALAELDAERLTRGRLRRQASAPASWHSEGTARASNY
ncbi:MAG TPA: hypothetical protein ENN80_09305 [Candidatus Hydrogenedentes bacterium]|nr:hypothetical protein [Candidatus Hydrogenedentota bacterium]